MTVIPLQAFADKRGAAERDEVRRSARQYKPEFSHEKAMAIMERDDRVLLGGAEWYGPRRWDVFQQNNQRFSEFYETIRDDPETLPGE